MTYRKKYCIDKIIVGIHWSEEMRPESVSYKTSRHKLFITVKPVLKGHSYLDKTKVFKTNGSLMKVESIAECSLGAFCNTFDLH